MYKAKRKGKTIEVDDQIKRWRKQYKAAGYPLRKPIVRRPKYFTRKNIKNIFA